MFTFKQKELADWQERNFGGTNSTCRTEWCLIGMFEELGEFAHWILKREQKIREAADGHDCKEEIADAFADVIVYGIQAMTCEGIDAEKAFTETVQKVLKRDWTKNPSGEGMSQHKQPEKAVD